MTSASVSLTDFSPATMDVDCVVLAVTAGPDGICVVEPQLSAHDIEALNHSAAAIGMKAAADEARHLPAPDGWRARSVVLVGLESNQPGPHELRYAAGSGVREAKRQRRLGLCLPCAGPLETAAVVEGALIGSYRFAAKKKAQDEVYVEEILVRGALAKDTFERALSCAEAVCFVRDLVNTPPNELFPQSMVEKVTAAFTGLPVDIEVFDEKRLVDQGFGGIMGVGSGSARPPRLMALRYTPAKATRHVALVGKGITFDSGGLSIKPATSMVGMKYDMTGAATIAGALWACARNGVSTSITAWLCLAENMPSGSALRPNDVISIHGGKTVEVLNTDAEGRLVMADGLQAASAESPDLIVDVATLTGAARIALGERYAGLMGEKEAIDELVAASERAGELVWPMPLPQELRSGLNSDVADIANVASGSTLGGMLVAGLFLREFVGMRKNEAGEESRIPWAHLDIAGPASNSSSAYGFTPKGPTGAITRTLIELLEA